jgi:molybdate transport system regulatory protein
VVLRLPAAADLGPGRVDLLEAVARVGSISGAAREVGMSYRKAWRLIDQMNAAFRNPVVATAFGGSRGGGARLSPIGQAVLAAYRAMERKLAETAKDELETLRGLAPR